MHQYIFGLFSLFILFSILGFAATPTLNSPKVSANALFLYRQSNFAKEDSDTTRNGMDLQEAELAFYSDVDPYSRLNMLLTVHPNYSSKTDAGGKVTVEQSWIVEPEELYAVSDAVLGSIICIGKFKAAMGKHNALHSHAYPFIDQPVANQKMLGDEGLNDVGISVATLLPTPWFSETTVQWLRGRGENAEFSSPSPGDSVGLLHLKNLWDVTDESTIEFGVSAAQGNNALRGVTRLTGLDLTFKGRPQVGGKYSSWILGGEYLDRNMQQNLAQPGSLDEKMAGWNIWGQVQFAERWAALLRYEEAVTLDSISVANEHTKKSSGAIVFNASEFSNYHLEFNQAEGPMKNNEHVEKKIYLQANFTIGAHPAHAY